MDPKPLNGLRAYTAQRYERGAVYTVLRQDSRRWWPLYLLRFSY